MAEKEVKKAKDPFRFYARLNLSELTGLKASTLEEFLERLKEVPDSVIYHHTHRFLQQHLYLSPEPPNDFAYWVTEALGEDDLGEMLASIDTVQFSTISALKDKMVKTVEEYAADKPGAGRRARQGEEFYFMKSVSFILPTEYYATDLEEFARMLEAVSIESIYFHMFEARLRLQKSTNDFSYWIESSVGDKKLASEIARLDPYTYTMEDLRIALVKMVKKRMIA